MRKAVFLDKDGTLVEDVPYNVDPDKIKLFPDTGEALLSLQNAGFLLIVISNQAGIAKGLFREDELLETFDKLKDMLWSFGVKIDGIFYCPHHPDGVVSDYTKSCFCRKPMPGMLKLAAAEYDIDLSASWMVGDILNDVEAGNAAGCNTLLIDNGNETEWVLNDRRKPDIVVKSLKEAANSIIFSQKEMVAGGKAYEGRGKENN